MNDGLACLRIWQEQQTTPLASADAACECERRLPPAPSGPPAFATLLFGATPIHLCGSLVLGHALQTSRPRVAVVTPEVERNAGAQLRAAGWILRVLPRLRDPRKAEARTPFDAMRASLWTKFNFWALVEFGRIWALDGDLLPLEPPFDDYLTSHIPALDEGDSPALAAMREVRWPRFNTGAMLLRPSLCTLSMLLRNATHNPPDPRTLERTGVYLGDQPAINTFFRSTASWSSRPAARTPQRCPVLG